MKNVYLLYTPNEKKSFGENVRKQHDDRKINVLRGIPFFIFALK